ncbi:MULTISPECIES: hypothetical protein [unclassified Streptomyces]|uniref:hypothetical protein n=1 Tax=unclassified Streptomyces TaxID=2593676 RepID=UPI002884FBA5|nr:hypothetical protein [Streptomyces sp. DSM 41633]
MTPALNERDRIRAAMDRILAGTPEHSNGALTIVALAQEAQLPRNALTQRHVDLKNEFYDKVRERGQTPDSEMRLRQQIVKLKELRANDKAEISQLQTDREALVRIVHQLTVENRQLRTELATPDSRVRVLPTQPQPTG